MKQCVTPLASFLILVTSVSFCTTAVSQSLFWSNPDTCTIYDFDITSGEEFRLIPFDVCRPTGLTIDENEGWIYFIQDGSIGRMRLDGTEVEEIVSGLGRVDGLETGSNGLWYFVADRTSIMSFDPQTFEIQSVLSDIEFITDLAVADQIYWGQSGTGIHTANLDGSDVTPIELDYDQSVASLSVSSVNGKIYWVVGWLSGGVFSSDLDGANEEQISDLPGSVISSSPDGTKLYVAVGHPNLGETEIYYVNLDGSGDEYITTGTLHAYYAALALSADGASMYAADYINGTIEKFNLAAAGRTVVRDGGGHYPNRLELYGPNLYWVSKNGPFVESLDLLTGSISTVVPLGDNGADPQGVVGGGIGIDPRTGDIYWSEPWQQQSIWKSNLSADNVEKILTEADADDIVVSNSGKLFYDKGFEIYSADTDGSNAQSIVCTMDWALDTDGSNAQSIVQTISFSTKSLAVDDTEGYLYWADRSESGVIHRVNLDGSNPFDLVSPDYGTVGALDVDPQLGKIAWIDTWTGTAKLSNLDGTGLIAGSNLTTGSVGGISLDSKLNVSAAEISGLVQGGESFAVASGDTLGSIEFSNIANVTSVRYATAASGGPVGLTPAVDRTIDVFADGEGYEAQLTIRYRDEEVEVGGVTTGESNLRLFQYTDGEWLVVTSAVDTVKNIVSASQLLTLGRFAIADPDLVPTALDDAPVTATYTASMEVYPNPTDGNFQILTRGSDLTRQRVEIYDILGRQILKTFGHPGAEIQIETYDWAPGHYLIRLTDGTQTLANSTVVVVR